MENKNLALALDYLKMGWNIIPVSKNKKSLIKWEQYQTERISVEQAHEWWTTWPNANIAVITGEISGIIALDIDKKYNRSGKEFQIPPTASARSGNGGEHYIFKHPGFYIKSQSAISGLGVDIRGDGGYLLLDPSINEGGGKYEWLTPRELLDTPADMPEWLLKLTRNNGIDRIWLAGLNGVMEGARNETAASLAGKILKSLPLELHDTAGWDSLLAWNKRNQFPLPEKELQSVFKSIKRYYDNPTFVVEKIPSVNFEKPKLWTINEILSHDFGEEDWLVEFLISKQGMTAISGNPGDFKTWITIHLAICISRGEPVFGKFKVKQGAVLIIDEEDHIRLLKKRLELLGAKETDNIFYLSQNGIKMDVPEVRDQILELVKENNIQLLILDSLVRVHGQDENDAKGMAKVFSNLQKIITAGASILFTHHHRKQQGFGKSNPGQSMRGSSDILAAVDCHITVEKKPEEERLIIKQSKLRQAELLPAFELNILKSDLGPSGFEYAGDYDEKKLKAQEVADALVFLLADGMKSRSEILELLGDEYGKTSIELGLKLAEENESIKRVRKDELPKENRKKAYYQLSTDLPASQPLIEEIKQEDEYLNF